MVEFNIKDDSQIVFISDYFYITIILGDIIEYKFIDSKHILRLKSNRKIEHCFEVDLILDLLKEKSENKLVFRAYNELLNSLECGGEQDVQV